MNVPMLLVARMLSVAKDWNCLWKYMLESIKKQERKKYYISDERAFVLHKLSEGQYILCGIQLKKYRRQ